MPTTALQSHASCFPPKIAPVRPRWGSHIPCSCADEEEPLEAVLGPWVAREHGKAAADFPAARSLALSPLPISLMLRQRLRPESAALPVWSVQKQICQQQWSTIAWHVLLRKEITLAFAFQRQPADGWGKKSILTIFSMSVCYFIPPVLWLRVGGKPRWHNATSWVCGSCVSLQMARLVPWVSHCVPWTPLLPLKCCSLGGGCRSQHSSENVVSTAWCSHCSTGQQGLWKRAHKQRKSYQRTGREGKINFCLLKNESGEEETSDQGGNIRLSSINQSLNNLTEWLGNAMLPTEALEIYI